MTVSRHAGDTATAQIKSPGLEDGGSPDRLHLTLGVEIEFILLHQHNPEDPDLALANGVRPDRLGRKLVADALRRPVDVRCRRCNEVHPYTLPTEGHLNRHDSSWPVWQVTEDGTLNLDDMREQFPGHKVAMLGDPLERHFEYFQIELRSRVFRVDQPITTIESDDKTHTHQISFEDEIKAVYDRINEFNTSAGQSGWRALVNETCGLHVHVGNEYRSFPLQTGKNLFAFCAANEKEIDSIHTASRINGTAVALYPEMHAELGFEDRPMWDAGHLNMPLSSHFAKISHALRNDLETFKECNEWWPYAREELDASDELRHALGKHDIKSWASLVDLARESLHVKTLQKFRDRTAGGHQSTVNFDHFLQYDPTNTDWKEQMIPKVTIEFRQHEGTLDATAALAWVDVVVRLVRHAHNMTSTDMKTEVEAIWRDSRYTALHLLEKLGYDKRDPVFKHYKNVMGLRGARNVRRRQHTYARALRTRQVKQEHKLQALPARQGKEDLLHDLMLWNAQQTYNRTQPGAARARIQEKFVKGCYGQFGEGYLDDLPGTPSDALTEDEKTRLTVGWTPPVERPYDPDELPLEKQDKLERERERREHRAAVEVAARERMDSSFSGSEDGEA